MQTINKIHITSEGYYGSFGGSFIPEMLYSNIEKLQTSYVDIIESEDFKKEFNHLLRDYVGRPTPLYLAKKLSEQYQCNIWLKREDLCHTGAHKINNAIGQILLAKHLGKSRIIAETGAGQHGVATATVAAMMGLPCFIYMGAEDIQRQAPNVARIKMLGASVIPVHSGNKTLKDATNEAIRDWINNPEDTYYIIGSVVGPHPYPDLVCRLQSVIGQEVANQLQKVINRNYPDLIIACVGGGSNAAGIFFDFLNNKHVSLIAVEAGGKGVQTSQTAATTFKGTKGIIHGSQTLVMQTKGGQIIEPYSISAGLDYPGIGPLFAHLKECNRANFFAINDNEAIQAAIHLSQSEGIIPALETAHAFAVLSNIKEQLKGKEVVINVSGRGDKDLATYSEFIKQ